VPRLHSGFSPAAPKQIHKAITLADLTQIEKAQFAKVRLETRGYKEVILLEKRFLSASNTDKTCLGFQRKDFVFIPCPSDNAGNFSSNTIRCFNQMVFFRHKVNGAEAYTPRDEADLLRREVDCPFPNGPGFVLAEKILFVGSVAMVADFSDERQASTTPSLHEPRTPKGIVWPEYKYSSPTFTLGRDDDQNAQPTSTMGTFVNADVAKYLERGIASAAAVGLVGYGLKLGIDRYKAYKTSSGDSAFGNAINEQEEVPMLTKRINDDSVAVEISS
jgi:hypothetical protein